MTDENQASEQDIVKILRYLAAAWPRFEVSAETVAVYVMHLRSRHATDVLLLAAMAMVDTSPFFPSVAELTGKAAEIEGERQCWYLTANYRLWGRDLPEALRLPAGMGRQVLGYEPAGRQESALEDGAGEVALVASLSRNGAAR